eukprot:1495142-Pyramimonas_sp.AAC.1
MPGVLLAQAHLVRVVEHGRLAQVALHLRHLVEGRVREGKRHQHHPIAERRIHFRPSVASGHIGGHAKQDKLEICFHFFHCFSLRRATA